MSIRFDAATERLSRTTNVISFDANYTVMAWVYVTTHNGTGNGACVVSIDDQTDDVDEFYLNASTSTNLTLGIVTLQGGSAAGDVGTATFTAGSWQHVCIVRSANNLRTGYRNGVSEVTHTLNRSGRTAPTAISIGSVLDSDLLNGRIACIKIWTEALTVAEIQQEIGCIHPVRMANLNRWTPCFTHTDIADYSGNGYGWTAVGTLTTEDGPPVSWGAAPWVVPFAVSAGVHDLTASAITTGAPAVDTPTIAQVHALTAAAITTGAPVLDTPSMSGSAALTADGITTSAPTLGAPTLAQIHALTASAIATGAPALGTATLGQTHALSAAGVATTAPTLGAPRLLPHLAATIGGVLRANATNGRYLENDSGPLVLAGFHTWYDLQDGGTSNPPDAFDWDTFLAALTSYGANLTKLWRLESTRHWPSDNTQYFGIQPWTRTGPGNAADGGLKFDLTAYNQDYFDRLRERCIELGNAGVYVVIQLFQGFHVDNTKEGGATGDPWAYNPFNSANNVNSVNGDIDGDGIGDDSRSTTNTACYNVQKSFVEHIVDTVNDLDNVLYEISNEDGTWSATWQAALVDYIHTYEAGKAKQHPVGFTKIYPGGSNSTLTSSNADWISPDEDLTPAAQNSTSQVWMYDTDHAVGITSERKWAWIALTQGYAGAWYMDLWDSGAGGAADTTADATYMQIRRTLGWLLDYAARVDLANATPQGSLSSTGYALAKTTGQAQILAYQSGSGAFTVDLSAITGTFSLEWQRVANSAGTVQAGSDVSGGAVRTLTPPWSGEDVVAFLEQTGVSGSLSATLGSLTVSATGVVPVVGSLAVTLGALTVSSAGVAPVTGVTTVTLGALTLSASGEVAVVGALDTTLGAATLAGAGTVAVTGTVDATLGALTLAAIAYVGEVPIQGTLNATLGELTCAATGVVPVAGVAASTLGALTSAGVGTVAVTGAAVVTLGAVTATATGAVAVVGVASVTLGELVLSATGYVGDVPAITGSLNVTLGALTVAGAGVVAFMTTFGRVVGPGGTGTTRGPKSSATIGV